MSDTVQIRLEKNGALVYQEAQTFARKQAAQAWVKRRETGLAVPRAIVRASRKGHAIKEMINRYLVEAESKRRTLTAIKNSYLSETVDSANTQQALVDYVAQDPGRGGAKPQTAGNDLAHLGSVLLLARANSSTRT